MPGEVSRSYEGPSDVTPLVPLHLLDCEGLVQGFINLLVYQAPFGEWFTKALAPNPNPTTPAGGYPTREDAVRSLLMVAAKAAQTSGT